VARPSIPAQYLKHSSPTEAVLKIRSRDLTRELPQRTKAIKAGISLVRERKLFNEIRAVNLGRRGGRRLRHKARNREKGNNLQGGEVANPQKTNLSLDNSYCIDTRALREYSMTEQGTKETRFLFHAVESRAVGIHAEKKPGEQVILSSTGQHAQEKLKSEKCSNRRRLTGSLSFVAAI